LLPARSQGWLAALFHGRFANAGCRSEANVLNELRTIAVPAIARYSDTDGIFYGINKAQASGETFSDAAIDN
jgi:hypothetical protein